MKNCIAILSLQLGHIYCLYLTVIVLVFAYISTEAFCQDQTNDKSTIRDRKPQIELDVPTERHKDTRSDKLRRLEERVGYDQSNLLLRYELAKQYDDEGFTMESIVEYEAVVFAMPNYVEALVRLGYMYLFAQKYEESKRVMSRALEIDANNTAAMSGLASLCYYGQVCKEDTRFVESMNLLARALDADPSNIVIRINQATILEDECYRRNGELCIEAISSWQDVIEKSYSSEMKEHARAKICIIKSYIAR